MVSEIWKLVVAMEGKVARSDGVIIEGKLIFSPGGFVANHRRGRLPRDRTLRAHALKRVTRPFEERQTRHEYRWRKLGYNSAGIGFMNLEYLPR